MSSPGIAEWFILFIYYGIPIILIILLIKYLLKKSTHNAPSGISIADELNKLNSLKEKGIITQEEFEKKKKELLQK